MSSSAGSGQAGSSPPDQIKAIPVRHPGQWVGAAVIAVLVGMFIHGALTNKAIEWSYMAHNIFVGPVREGALVTVELTVFSMIFGSVLGAILAVMRLSSNRILSYAAWVYIWFFRAIPIYVLLTIMGSFGALYPRVSIGIPFGGWVLSHLTIHGYHGTIASVNSNDFFRGFKVGLLGLGLSEAAYMAEIVRAGITSVDPGQMEAAESVGMNRMQAMRRIVLPQAMRVIIPPTGNETIAMLKNTSLVVAVPVTTELFFQLEAIGNRTFHIIPLLVASVIWYLALSSILMTGQYFVERRYARGFGRTNRKQGVETVIIGGSNHI
jgi:polar amino acid transport system permease protein